MSKLNILYEDNHIIVVVKPYNVLSQGDATGDRSIMDDIKDYIKVLEEHLKGKKYFVGNAVTLADIVMFNVLRFFFQLVWVEGMRKNLLPNVTAWFTEMMNTPEAVKVYGRTVLCKLTLKPYVAPEKKEEKKKEEKKKEEKKEVAEEPKEG